MTDRLIVFTRYPEPGNTKTRLIPALGAEGAAALQRQMTEHTLAQIRLLQITQPISVEIRFTHAGSPEDIQQKQRLMQDWLGTELDYQPQSQGNLGDRMVQAFEAAFAAGIERAVTIGTDCPSVNAVILRQAFAALQQHDLVLGPATDGGYYLIGLRRSVPELFEGIAWSTASVFQQTVQIAERLGLAIAYLEPLTDIDRPDDLPIWERIAATQTAHPPDLISVIIPVLNEEQTIQSVLAHVLHSADHLANDLEVIVIDGGSRDRTVELAESMGVRVMTAAPGRAHQMNIGARAAIGSILLFLHADTRLPSGFANLVRQTLSQPKTVAGAFDLKIEGNLPGLRWVERGVAWRSRYLQMPYGDQALFLRTDTFNQLGGFPEISIMEDFELVCRLKSMGRVAIAPAAVTTSSRRWQQLGIWKTTLINQLIITAYFLGFSPKRLAQWYGSYRRG